MVGIEERTIDLTILSAHDLKKVGFGHQKYYAVAYIYSNDKKSSPVDRNGGINPEWNSELSLTCDERLLHSGGSYITIDIYNHGSFGSKIVGTSKIWLLDVWKEGKAGKPINMSFEVLRPSGKTKGALNVNVRLGSKRTLQIPESNAPTSRYGKHQRDETPLRYPQTATGSKIGSAASYQPNAAQAGSSGAYGSKTEEPVLAYPATAGYPGVYPPQQYGNYGSPYGTPYNPSPQANAPYDYQQAYYSKPPRRQGGSSAFGGGTLGGGGGNGGLGLGLLGGALGGFLLGDLIGGDLGGGFGGGGGFDGGGFGF